MQYPSRRISLLYTVVVVLFVSVPLVAKAQAKRGVEPYAVATAHPYATDAAMQILAEGGNAFDAAVAASAALAVVEPYSSGMGGGGFWLLYLAAEDRYIFVDGRERAPAKAHPDLYLDAEGKLTAKASINGALAAGIPGQPAALAHIAATYGSRSLAVLFQPAIRAARHGFVAEKKYRMMAGFRQKALSDKGDARFIFLQNGVVPVSDVVIVQPDLADSLEQMADTNGKAFYRGGLARKMVAGVRAAGGIWHKRDLKNYAVVERDPIRFRFRGMDVISAPPPSSGGIALAQMFQMLDTQDVTDVQRANIHLMSEVMRRAYFDRAWFLGDPDYFKVPQARLLSASHNTAWMESYHSTTATVSAALGTGGDAGTGGDHTTHFSIVDGQGNIVSATLSINYPFGSGFVPPGTGILLNDEMDDFSAQPGVPNAYGLVGGEANKIEAGKRPLSSMSPSIARIDDATAVVGTPGGSRIITMVFLALLDFWNGMEPEVWVRGDRYHHQYLPDSIQVEPALEKGAILHSLQEKGHGIQSVGRQWGNMQVILHERARNSVTAVSDPRGIGSARVSD